MKKLNPAPSLDSITKTPKPLSNIAVRFFLQSLYNCISHSEENAKLISHLDSNDRLEELYNKASGNFLARNSFSTAIRWLSSIGAYIYDYYYNICFIKKVELLGKYVLELRQLPTRTFRLYGLVLDKAPTQFEKLYDDSMCVVTIAVPMLESVLSFKYYEEKLKDVKIGDTIILNNVTPYPYVNRIKPFSAKIEKADQANSVFSNLFTFMDLGFADIKSLYSSCNYSFFIDTYSEQKQFRLIGAPRIVSGKLICASPTITIKNGNHTLELYPTEKLLKSLGTDLSGIENYENKWVSILSIFWYNFGWNLPEYPEALSLKIITEPEAQLRDLKAHVRFKGKLPISEMSETSSQLLDALISEKDVEIANNYIVFTKDRDNSPYPLINNVFPDSDFSINFEKKIINLFEKMTCCYGLANDVVTETFSCDLSLILNSYQANRDYILNLFKRKKNLAKIFSLITFFSDIQKGCIDCLLQKDSKIRREANYYEWLGLITLEQNKKSWFAHTTDLGKKTLYDLNFNETRKLTKGLFEKCGILSISYIQQYLYNQNYPLPKSIIKLIIGDLESQDYITKPKVKNDVNYAGTISTSFRIITPIDGTNESHLINDLLNYFKKLETAILQVLSNIPHGLGSSKIAEQIETRKLVAPFNCSILTDDVEIVCSHLKLSGVLEKESTIWFYPYLRRIEDFLKNNCNGFFRKNQIEDCCSIPFFEIDKNIAKLEKLGIIDCFSNFYSIKIEGEQVNTKKKRLLRQEAERLISTVLEKRRKIHKQNLINLVTPTIFKLAREIGTSTSSLIIVNETIKSLISEKHIISQSDILIFNKKIEGKY